MQMFSLILACFGFVHVFCILKTTRSSFYWASKLLLSLEAVQSGGIRSIPIWYRTWKKMYSVEATALKKNLSEV